MAQSLAAAAAVAPSMSFSACGTASGRCSCARFAASSQFLGTALAVRQAPARQRRDARLAVRAEGEEVGKGKEGTQFGLGGPGTWFGFGERQERNVGRLAMIGFASGVTMEVITGKGVLAQLGINPELIRYPFLAGMAFLFIAGLLGGYTVINNPPDKSKAPPNEGLGIPRDPLKTYDPTTPDPLTTYTRGGVVDRPDGQKGREPYVSDIELPKK